MNVFEEAFKELREKNPGTPEQPIYDKNKYNIVTITAYLVGVDERFFVEKNGLSLEEYKRLNQNKNARIIRNLCMFRTAIAKNFTRIYPQMTQEKKGLATIEEVPNEIIANLSSDGVSFRNYTEPGSYLMEANSFISDRINNCKNIYPDWINWKYIKELFVLPSWLSKDGAIQASQQYGIAKYNYPYQCFINWIPSDDGNLLHNDKKFVTLLYESYGDEFTDISKVEDIGFYASARFEEFLNKGTRIVMAIDGENSDPYKFCAVLQALSDEQLDKISKIFVYDDINASSVWQNLEKYTEGIPVEYDLVDRVKYDKSALDIALTTAVTLEYANNVDSFILFSSDSDYWAMIQRLPNARFLVMVEEDAVSPRLKQTLKEHHIPYCSMDDYYSGNLSAIKYEALLSDVKIYIEQHMCISISEMMESAKQTTRVELNEREEREFVNNYIKTAKLEINESGQFTIQLKKI